MAEAHPPSPRNDTTNNDENDEYEKSSIPISNRSLDPPMVAAVAMPLEEEDEETANIMQALAVVEDCSQELDPSCSSAADPSRDVAVDIEAVHIDEAVESGEQEEQEQEPQHKPQSQKRKYYKWLGILLVGFIIGAVLASIPAILNSNRRNNMNSAEGNTTTADMIASHVPSAAPSACFAYQKSTTASIPLNGISFDHFGMTSNLVVLSSPSSPSFDPYFATLPFDSNATRSGHDDTYDIIKLLLLDDNQILLGLSNYSTDAVFVNQVVTSDSVVILFYNSDTLQWENSGVLHLDPDNVLVDLTSNQFGRFFAGVVLDKFGDAALQFVSIAEAGELMYTGQFGSPAFSKNTRICMTQRSLLVAYTDNGYLQLFNGSTGLMQFEGAVDLVANVEEGDALIMDDLQLSENFDVFLVLSHVPGMPCYVATPTNSVPLLAPFLPNATIQLGSLSSNGESIVLATSYLDSDQNRNVASIYRRVGSNDWIIVETLDLVNGALRGIFLDNDNQLVVLTNDVLQVYQLDCGTTRDIPSVAPAIAETLPSAAPSCPSTYERGASSPIGSEGSRFDHLVLTSNRAVFSYAQQAYFETLQYDGDSISATQSLHTELYDIISMELVSDSLVLGLSNYEMMTLADNTTFGRDAVLVLKLNNTAWQPTSSILLGSDDQFLEVVTNAGGKFFAAVVLNDRGATSLQFAMVDPNDESNVLFVGQFSTSQLSENTLLRMSQLNLLAVYSDNGFLQLFDGATGLFQSQGSIDLGAQVPDGESLVMDGLQSSDSFDVFMVFSHKPGTPVYVASQRDGTSSSVTLLAPDRANATIQMGSLSSNGASLVMATSYNDGRNRNVANIYRSNDWTVVETIDLMDGELRGILLANDRMVVATNQLLQVYELKCV